MGKFNFFVIVIAGLVLSAAASATASAGDSPTKQQNHHPERDHHEPLAPELAGMIDREVKRAMEGLQGLDLDQLEGMARLEALSALSVLADLPETIELADNAEKNAGTTDHRDNGRDEPTGPLIDERRPLNADGRVYVNNVAGLVDIATWDRNEVSISGALGDRDQQLEVTGDASTVSVVVRLPKKKHITGDTILKLHVPTGARVELETVSADVSMDGTRGVVKINTVSGDVGLSLGSPEVTVQTVSGDLRLHAPAKLTKVNSVSGDMHMAGLQGKLSVETVSGNVELEGGKFSELRLKSISGDMRLDVSLADAAQITGETLSGEITVVVPIALTGTALLKSFSGEARCDGAHVVDYQNGHKREYVWGDGKGARIELSSFSGDIHIERK